VGHSDHPSSLRQRTLLLQERAFNFARRVLELCPRAIEDEPSLVVWRQLVRSAPSASANLEEADEASSDAEFVFRMKVAAREMKESRLWLRFIDRCRLANFERLDHLEDEARQLAAIFSTIVMNTKRRVKAEKASKRAKDSPRA
jgi:four helix bundle protein